MAHGDYNCCALCDCKLSYNPYDATTKEEICIACLKQLHNGGVMVYTGDELAEWIGANQQKASTLLPILGLSQCFYGNKVDRAFAEAKSVTVTVDEEQKEKGE